MKNVFKTLLFANAAFFANHAAAMNSAQLQALVEQRLIDDRTGACFAVAVIEESVSFARACADPAQVERIGPDRAFEIGSVTKTMTSALLAKLILDGKASLDDPLSKWMPEDAVVPSFEGAPILLRHIVTHTSGLPALPPDVAIVDPRNPYAALTPEQLRGSLTGVLLTRAPGAAFEYSNFAVMLLSDALARQAGVPFDELLEQDVFGPLGMKGAFVGAPPAGVTMAAGHLPGGAEAPAWDFPSALSGAGGVRATLDAMVLYVRAHLDRRPSPLDPALALTRERVEVGGSVVMGMGWMLAPVAGRTVQVHEGGTGGFSSFVAIDRDKNRGIVILSDTALASTGGLAAFGLHLLEPGVPPGAPAKEVPAPAELLEGLVGDYRFVDGMEVKLSIFDGALAVQVPGQPQLVLSHDDTGAFYPTGIDAVLRPQRLSDGRYSFTWHQGGATLVATRVDQAPFKPDVELPKSDLDGYAGEYPLMLNFGLTVFAQEGRLMIQGTGQPALALEHAATDVFVNATVGVEIRFERGGDGRVNALTLLQNGQAIRGERR